MAVALATHQAPTPLLSVNPNLLLAQMNDDSPLYSMSDAAPRVGVSSKTLVEYEACGLIKPKRTSRGIRLYTDADIAAARRIHAARIERRGKTGPRLRPL